MLLVPSNHRASDGQTTVSRNDASRFAGAAAA